MSERFLYFRNFKTGETSGHVNVANRSEREIERCTRGMLINKHDDWIVCDSADDEAAAVPRHSLGDK